MKVVNGACVASKVTTLFKSIEVTDEARVGSQVVMLNLVTASGKVILFIPAEILEKPVHVAPPSVVVNFRFPTTGIKGLSTIFNCWTVEAVPSTVHDKLSTVVTSPAYLMLKVLDPLFQKVVTGVMIKSSASCHSIDFGSELKFVQTTVAMSPFSG